MDVQRAVLGVVPDPSADAVDTFVNNWQTVAPQQLSDYSDREAMQAALLCHPNATPGCWDSGRVSRQADNRPVQHVPRTQPKWVHPVLPST